MNVRVTTIPQSIDFVIDCDEVPLPGDLVDVNGVDAEYFMTVIHRRWYQDGTGKLNPQVIVL